MTEKTSQYTAILVILLVVLAIGASVFYIRQNITPEPQPQPPQSNQQLPTEQKPPSGQQPPSGEEPTPPPPDQEMKGPIGYVGCSMTMNARAGYEAQGGTKFWPVISYGGGTITAWSQDLSSNSRYWSGFQSTFKLYPKTKIIWWELCTAEKTRDTDNYKNAIIVLNEIKRKLPQAIIYVSAQPDYTNNHICQIAGEGGTALMKQVAVKLVADGKALAGPIIGPLTPAQTADGCHGNKEGNALMGKQLIAFFGP